MAGAARWGLKQDLRNEHIGTHLLAKWQGRPVGV